MLLVCYWLSTLQLCCRLHCELKSIASVAFTNSTIYRYQNKIEIPPQISSISYIFFHLLKKITNIARCATNNSKATLKPLTFMRHVSVLHTTSAETGIAHWDRRKLCPASATASVTASTSRRTFRGQRAMRLDIGMGLLHRPDAVATGTSGIYVCIYVVCTQRYIQSCQV